MEDVKPYEQWAWVQREPDGSETLIVSYLETLGTLAPLADRSEAIARSMQPFARQYAELSGKAVRIVHLKEYRTGVR